MPVLHVIGAFGLAAAVTYLLVPPLIRLAQHLGLVKEPGGRHIHRHPTPLLGGAALFLGTASAGMLLATDWRFLTALSLAFAVGLLDDWLKCRGRELSALPKLFLQMLPALLWVSGGHTIRFLSHPLPNVGYILLPTWLSTLFTLIWLLGMMNAVNFIDGMDGLAAGVVQLSATFLALTALLRGDVAVAVWLAAIAGACLAFLRFNFHPAKVFMGDAGSNVLGFFLAALAIRGYLKTATLTSLAASFLFFAIPLFNVGFVLLRRLRLGKSFYRALTEGDLEHSFNVVSRKFRLTPTQTVALFWTMELVTSGLGAMLVLMR